MKTPWLVIIHFWQLAVDPCGKTHWWIKDMVGRRAKAVDLIPYRLVDINVGTPRWTADDIHMIIQTVSFTSSLYYNNVYWRCGSNSSSANLYRGRTWPKAAVLSRVHQHVSCNNQHLHSLCLAGAQQSYCRDHKSRAPTMHRWLDCMSNINQLNIIDTVFSKSRDECVQSYRPT